jgi:hypothetical protein
MNTQESKILHGLYFHRQMIGEELIYKAGELNWLATHSFKEGRSWQRPDGTLNSLESNIEYLVGLSGAHTTDSLRPIRYLESKGYITFKNSADFQLSVTLAGAEVARELGTPLGRVNVLYKNHKDGVVWLFATILVSAVTSILTKCSG